MDDVNEGDETFEYVAVVNLKNHDALRAWGGVKNRERTYLNKRKGELSRICIAVKTCVHSVKML